MFSHFQLSNHHIDNLYSREWIIFIHLQMRIMGNLFFSSRLISAEIIFNQVILKISDKFSITEDIFACSKKLWPPRKLLHCTPYIVFSPHFYSWKSKWEHHKYFIFDLIYTIVISVLWPSGCGEVVNWKVINLALIVSSEINFFRDICVRIFSFFIFGLNVHLFGGRWF